MDIRYGFVSARSHLLYGAIGVALLAGCQNIPATSHDVIELQSCTSNARSVRFDLNYTSAWVSSISLESQSANVVGTPTIDDLGFGTFQITAELNNAALNEAVSLGFAAQMGQYGAAWVGDVHFYNVPPADITDAEPSCTPGVLPEIALDNAPALGLHMQVSNPGAGTLTLESLELAQSPVLLPPSALHWGGADFEGLTWTPGVVGGAPLVSGSPPLVIDLPESALPGTRAVLCRFVSGGEAGFTSRVITEVDLASGPLATKPSTWGAIKALYHNP